MIYDSDIAERLCTLSELKRKRGDELPPNSRERDHPRACGENRQRIPAKRLQRGSPPRMRGKRKFVDFVTSDERITPAHAGKTRPGNAF